jgi:hypothetical protein
MEPTGIGSAKQLRCMLLDVRLAFVIGSVIGSQAALVAVGDALRLLFPGLRWDRELIIWAVDHCGVRFVQHWNFDDAALRL